MQLTTQAEWNTHFVAHGAAGVLLTDGRIVIGDGNALAHTEILALADIPQKREKYRLQICRNIAWAELWLDDEKLNYCNPTEKEVRDAFFKKYKETLEQIEAQLAKAVAPFMGAVPVKAVPLNMDQEPFIKRHKKFIQSCVTGRL